MAEQMVERVARAISKQFGVTNVEECWPYAIPHARAAIEAMREPNPEMLKVAGKWWEATLHNSKTGWENGEIIYLAMIDVALKG